ncbi:ribonuclease D [Jatrophihabitans sp.]|uniref:ribonuclease D n=1 Tax=Jatrophihabitans sp. TaxID=1932789 RepID=UPI002C8F5692|nr:ribonuclease D [Jatrophihabitans sp.]
MASERTASGDPAGEPEVSAADRNRPAEPGQAAGSEEQPDQPAAPLLRAPADGTPDPLTTPAELAAAAAGLAAGHGPVAVDAERASGYRYSQRAYLVQLRRAGYGTVLIDPIALPDLSSVDQALAGAEWILHAASQDLTCLAELGMRPRRLFDTELAGRLLGSERVALGTMVEQYLGISLEKGHSAADWSTRPLPADWLNYAALDVELLIELREVLVGELARTGKLAWAEQEFEAILQAGPPAPRGDPWRRTSGIHNLRNRRQLAMVRSLWQARDRLAAERDVAPGRTLPDAAILAAVKANPKSQAELGNVAVFNGPRQRRLAGYWFKALSEGRETPEDQLPPLSQLSADPDAMPSPARWRDRDPAAAVRLAACKQVVTEVGAQHRLLSQNLLAGDVLRRLAWRSVTPLTEAAVRARLAELGARPWQIDLLAERLTEALGTQAPEPPPPD